MLAILRSPFAPANAPAHEAKPRGGELVETLGNFDGHPDPVSPVFQLA
jgi:hypothetical protein